MQSASDRPKRGRPATGRSRTAKIVCRVQPHLKAEIESAAAAAGVTVSQLILSALRERLDQTQAVSAS